MRWITRGIVVLALMLVSSQTLWAQPTIETTENKVLVKLNDHVTLTYLLKDGLLLGLNQASVDGVQLSSADTVQRPILAQEWGEKRMNWPFMKFKEAKVVNGKVHVIATLLGTHEQAANRDIFVYRGFPKKAIAAGLPKELETLRVRTEEAKKALAPLAEKDTEVIKFRKRIKDLEAQIAKEKSAGKKKKQERNLKKNQDRLASALRSAINRAIKDPKNAKIAAPALEYKTKLNDYALEKFGDIHRDYYRLPHLRQPAEVCTIEWVLQSYEKVKSTLQAGGEITIVLEPHSRNVAGWPYEGWKQHYEFSLSDGEKLNVLRQMGTWEIDGEAAGVTLTGMRYRGLGDIEEELESDGKGGVKNAYSTTETMPGAVGGAPLISPVIPSSKDVNDRGFALRHRAGAWIVRMARGGGAPFVDFQFKPHAVFTSFLEKQGNFKALTEIFPGDRFISQTDEEYFHNTSNGKTEPQVYIALVDQAKPFSIDELRNRWQEIDQHVRDTVSEELGFVQFEVLPGIGTLTDHGWAGYYKGMTNRGIDNWKEMGVRIIAYHNPGFPNGRYQGPAGHPKTPKKVGGGVANPYDWKPTADVEKPWTDFQKKAAKEGMPYYPWIGQTQQRNSPFTDRIGYDKKHWSLNGPYDDHGPGYGPSNMKGNIYDETFRNELNKTFKHTFTNHGFQGFWVDSFQNLMMSQLEWASGSGTSMQRGWWEFFAEWSRNGVALMSESHAFPGMSCSIEIHSWQEDFWYMGHVWKWYRGDAINRFKGKEQKLDDNLFHMMSVKGWTAPDKAYKHDGNMYIPSFKRMAHEYLAALEDMRRGYILPGGKGMIWLRYDDNDNAIVFPYEEMNLPAGVTAEHILDAGKKVNKIKKQHTYRVKGKDVVKQFGIRVAPLEDPRFGREYKTPEYAWPVK